MSLLFGPTPHQRVLIEQDTQEPGSYADMSEGHRRQMRELQEELAKVKAQLKVAEKQRENFRQRGKELQAKHNALKAKHANCEKEKVVNDHEERARRLQDQTRNLERRIEYLKEAAKQAQDHSHTAANQSGDASSSSANPLPEPGTSVTTKERRRSRRVSFALPQDAKSELITDMDTTHNDPLFEEFAFDHNTPRARRRVGAIADINSHEYEVIESEFTNNFNNSTPLRSGRYLLEETDTDTEATTSVRRLHRRRSSNEYNGDNGTHYRRSHASTTSQPHGGVNVTHQVTNNSLSWIFLLIIVVIISAVMQAIRGD
ncbi:hypothetical protein B0T21DRAFT_357513 [Apiosordaria backusii]|uniref:Uncharacterized protein n=1 Tax=Apiosordaria backusii TaxID=314023 RepID=A0AA40ERW6_9PEZI|nr:hypothetical protein B0T21DRAFT_357513 [Apiosordaria backusii]